MSHVSHLFVIGLAGARVRERSMLELGTSLPGLKPRAAALGGPPHLGLLMLAALTPEDRTGALHEPADPLAPAGRIDPDRVAALARSHDRVWLAGPEGGAAPARPFIASSASMTVLLLLLAAIVRPRGLHQKCASASPVLAAHGFVEAPRRKSADVPSSPRLASPATTIPRRIEHELPGQPARSGLTALPGFERWRSALDVASLHR